MTKYLIALDLDGTLLYDWETLREDTADYLKRLKAQGHKLVIATGRPYRSSQRFYDLLELDTPIINYNGGLVTWPQNPDFEPVNLLLDRSDVLEIFDANKDHIYNAFCEINDDIYLVEKREDIMPLIHFFNGAKLHVGPFHETLPSGPNGCIIVAHKNRGQHIESFIKTHYSDKILSRNWGSEYRFIIELFTPKTNKAEGLKVVAKALGFPRERIIAFGDGHNDVEMLHYAGVGVAMKNAHPDLLAVADVVSPHRHTEYAIERFLDDYLK